MPDNDDDWLDELFDDDFEDENDGLSFKSGSFNPKRMLYEIYAVLFSAILFFFFSLGKHYSSLRDFGYIFLVNVIITVITSIMGLILFDFIIPKYTKMKGNKLFDFNVDKLIYKFVKNFFMIILLSIIFLVMAIYMPSGYNFIYYLAVKIITTFVGMALANMIAKKYIAVVSLAFSLGILICVAVFNVIQNQNML